MKDVPDIDPEVRALVQEVVDDPRSALRFAPQRALLPWLQSGDTLGHVSGTKAEQHLVRVHRDALARLFYEASRIAHYKAPFLTHVRRPFSVIAAEQDWSARVRRILRFAGATDDVELLRQCLDGVLPESGPALAQASLALMMRSEARFFLALGLRRTSLKTATRLLQRLAADTSDEVAPHALLAGGSCLFSLGLLAEARETYWDASLSHGAALGAVYGFNLSCLLGDVQGARSAVSDVQSAEEQTIIEAGEIISSTLADLNPVSLGRAKIVAAELGDSVPEPARRLCAIYL